MSGFVDIPQEVLKVLVAFSMLASMVSTRADYSQKHYPLVLFLEIQLGTVQECRFKLENNDSLQFLPGAAIKNVNQLCATLQIHITLAQKFAM